MVTTLISGLSVGAIYALVAITFSLPIAQSGIFNFAHASYIVAGIFVCTDLITRLHWPTLAVFVLLLVLGGTLGALQEMLTIRPTQGRVEGTLLTTVGAAVLIDGFVLVFWGTDPRSVSFFGGQQVISLFGGRGQPIDFWLIGLAVVAGLGAELAMRFSRWGMVGRAVMADGVAATLHGINIARNRTIAFAVAGACAGGLAIFIGPKLGASAGSDFHLAIFAFAAATLGGLGSFAGALAGGFAIGLIEAFSSRYLGVDYVGILVFAVLAIVLVSRPGGIFGRKSLRVV